MRRFFVLLGVIEMILFLAAAAVLFGTPFKRTGMVLGAVWAVALFAMVMMGLLTQV